MVTAKETRSYVWCDNRNGTYTYIDIAKDRSACYIQVCERDTLSFQPFRLDRDVAARLLVEFRKAAAAGTHTLKGRRKGFVILDGARVQCTTHWGEW